MDASLGVALVALAGTAWSTVLTYRASSRATAAQTQASQQANDINERAGQLQWVKELRAEAADAKKEVKELRGEVTDLRRQLDVVTREAEQLVAELKLMRRTAWREGMTMDRFRDFIGPPSSSANGRPA